MIDRAVADPMVLDETSEVYLGEWNQLVSTTNWEKGRIILQWREALIAAGADPIEYADEAWSRRVGNVSGQHVGRLRRVFERFGGLRQTYGRLFWSHFQAALDWDDAEMWLEGALQSRWSISEMRRQRWQAIGAPEDLKPQDEDVIAGELDEDAFGEDSDGGGSSGEASVAPSAARETAREVDGTDDDQEEGELASIDEDREDEDEGTNGSSRDGARFEPVRPFADLPDLPDDLSDAFESYKLAILRHKLAGWTEISQTDVLASLDSLKQLALAPAE